MPAITLYVRAPQTVVLSLSAQRAVQGMLYSLLKTDATLARHMHDEGSFLKGIHIILHVFTSGHA